MSHRAIISSLKNPSMLDHQSFCSQSSYVTTWLRFPSFLYQGLLPSGISSDLLFSYSLPTHPLHSVKSLNTQSRSQVTYHCKPAYKLYFCNTYTYYWRGSLWGSSQPGCRRQSSLRPSSNRSLNSCSSHMPLPTRNAVKPKMRMWAQLLKLFCRTAILIRATQWHESCFYQCLIIKCF